MSDIKTIQVIGTYFDNIKDPSRKGKKKGEGKKGDFPWMLNQKIYDKALFLFNDNEGQFDAFRKGTRGHPGGGNAAIRPFQYVDSKPPRAAGFSTGKGVEGYKTLNKNVEAKIDEAFVYITKLVKSGYYDEVYYSADKGGKNIGYSIFGETIGDDVKKYLNTKIEKLKKVTYAKFNENDASRLAFLISKKEHVYKNLSEDKKKELDDEINKLRAKQYKDYIPYKKEVESDEIKNNVIKYQKEFKEKEQEKEKEKKTLKDILVWTLDLAGNLKLDIDNDGKIFKLRDDSFPLTNAQTAIVKYKIELEQYFNLVSEPKTSGREITFNIDNIKSDQKENLPQLLKYFVNKDKIFTEKYIKNIAIMLLYYIKNRLNIVKNDSFQRVDGGQFYYRALPLVSPNDKESPPFTMYLSTTSKPPTKTGYEMSLAFGSQGQATEIQSKLNNILLDNLKNDVFFKQFFTLENKDKETGYYNNNIYLSYYLMEQITEFLDSISSKEIIPKLLGVTSAPLPTKLNELNKLDTELSIIGLNMLYLTYPGTLKEQTDNDDIVKFLEFANNMLQTYASIAKNDPKAKEEYDKYELPRIDLHHYLVTGGTKYDEEIKRINDMYAKFKPMSGGVEIEVMDDPPKDPEDPKDAPEDALEDPLKEKKKKKEEDEYKKYIKNRLKIFAKLVGCTVPEEAKKEEEEEEEAKKEEEEGYIGLATMGFGGNGEITFENYIKKYVKNKNDFKQYYYYLATLIPTACKDNYDKADETIKKLFEFIKEKPSESKVKTKVKTKVDPPPKLEDKKYTLYENTNVPKRNETRISFNDKLGYKGNTVRGKEVKDKLCPDTSKGIVVIAENKDENAFRIISFNVHNWHSICEDLPESGLRNNPQNAFTFIKNELPDPDFLAFVEYVLYPESKEKATSHTTTGEIEVSSEFVTGQIKSDFKLNNYVISNDFEHTDKKTFMGKAMYGKGLTGSAGYVLDDKHEDRGVLITRVDIHDIPVDVFLVHLIFNDSSAFKNELNNLKTILNKYKKSNPNQIVMGDFNNDYQNHKKKYDQYFAEYTLQNKPTIPTSFNQTPKGDTVDLIFTSNEFLEKFEVTNKENVVVESDASDHFPVYIDIMKLKKTEEGKILDITLPEGKTEKTVHFKHQTSTSICVLGSFYIAHAILRGMNISPNILHDKIVVTDGPDTINGIYESLNITPQGVNLNENLPNVSYVKNNYKIWENQSMLGDVFDGTVTQIQNMTNANKFKTKFKTILDILKAYDIPIYILQFVYGSIGMAFAYNNGTYYFIDTHNASPGAGNSGTMFIANTVDKIIDGATTSGSMNDGFKKATVISTDLLRIDEAGNNISKLRKIAPDHITEESKVRKWINEYKEQVNATLIDFSVYVPKTPP